MNRIRLAKPEEIDKIKEHSDIDAGCSVLALDTHLGTGLAVRRVCEEIDPLVCPEEWNTKLRAVFIRDIETVMAAQGIPHYYFNVLVEDEKWQEVIKTWGAEQLSTAPEYRFKRVL